MRDFMTESGAIHLAAVIEAYWKERGYDRVRAWATIEAGKGTGPVNVVRSNMINGFPPTGGERPDA